MSQSGSGSGETGPSGLDHVGSVCEADSDHFIKVRHEDSRVGRERLGMLVEVQLEDEAWPCRDDVTPCFGDVHVHVEVGACQAAVELTVLASVPGLQKTRVNTRGAVRVEESGWRR